MPRLSPTLMQVSSFGRLFRLHLSIFCNVLQGCVKLVMLDHPSGFFWILSVSFKIIRILSTLLTIEASTWQHKGTDNVFSISTSMLY